MRTNPAVLILLIISGCTSYQFITTEGVPQERVARTEPAYIVNRNLEDEFDILKCSGLYDISDDSTVPTRITLNELRVAPSCGTPLGMTILTLGLFPGVVYDRYEFSYIENTSAGNIERTIPIVLKMRVSAYELFVPGNRKNEIAEGLRNALKAQQ